MNIKSLIAECIGTFALIFIGAGALAIGHADLLGVALAHAFVVIGFIYAYGHLSGTHINPAVTLAFLVAGEIRLGTAIGYWTVQLLGALFGAFLLKVLLPTPGDLGVTILSPDVTPLQGMLVETLLTFLLVNTIFNTAVSGKAGGFAGLAIGVTLVFCILMGGPLTRAGLNPARTLGPAIVSGTYTDLWLYLVGPCVGAILAALLYVGVLKENGRV